MNRFFSKLWATWAWILGITGLVMGWQFLSGSYDLVIDTFLQFPDVQWVSFVKSTLWLIIYLMSAWLLLLWAANTDGFRTGELPMYEKKSLEDEKKPRRNTSLPELNQISHKNAKVQLAADVLDDLITSFDMSDNQTAHETNKLIDEAREAIEQLKGEAHLKGYLKKFRAQLQQITDQIRSGGSEERRYGPTAEEMEEARVSLMSVGSGRVSVDADVAQYRKDDPDFVPAYDLEPRQKKAILSVPEEERGGISVSWDDDFKEDDKLEDIISSHPKVISMKYDEGRWYSNGEIGPPYYQFHIGCLKADEDEIKAYIREKGRDRIGKSMSNVSIS
jgi:hypothetical protein